MKMKQPMLLQRGCFLLRFPLSSMGKLTKIVDGKRLSDERIIQAAGDYYRNECSHLMNIL
jgi:hypothetical protein